MHDEFITVSRISEASLYQGGFHDQLRYDMTRSFAVVRQGVFDYTLRVLQHMLLRNILSEVFIKCKHQYRTWRLFHFLWLRTFAVHPAKQKTQPSFTLIIQPRMMKAHSRHRKGSDPEYHPFA